MALIGRFREMLRRKEVFGQREKQEFTDITSLIFYPDQEQLILKKDYTEQRLFGIKWIFTTHATDVRSFESEPISLVMSFVHPIRVVCSEGRCEVNP